MARVCGLVQDQLNFPSTVTVQERVRLQLTFSEEQVTLAAGTKLVRLLTAAKKFSTDCKSVE